MSEIRGGDGFEAALKELARKYRGGEVLKVGFLEGATYPDGTSVATVAAIQNFGAPSRGIPPRPFFTNMVNEKQGEWGPALGGILRANGGDVPSALALLGEGIAGQLRQSIVDTSEPPLSPVTLMLRKMRADNPDLVVGGRVVGEAAARVAAGESSTGVSTKPLVYTAHMLNSVGSEVSE